MLTIKAPENCPSCGHKVKLNDYIIFCVNPNCESQVNKKIEHFAHTLKIKGLGPAAVSKLDLDDISELYSLTKSDLVKALSSEKIADKLFYEIENSINASLNTVLPAFSIPLIGKSATEKLATICDNIFDINTVTCAEAGLGIKTTESLLTWLKNNLDLVERLPFSFKFDKPRTQINVGIVCISGKLKSYKTKAEATKVLESLGYIVRPNLTKDVMILVNESGVESAKTLKARESGTIIVTNLKEFIGENI